MSKLSAPVLQRQLKRGCSGGDVLAVQRAVYVSLNKHNAKGTNARNGEYGPKTERDIRTLQKILKLNSSGNVGLNTLLALWHQENAFDAGAFDDYGVQLLYRVKLGHPTDIPTGGLKKGAHGPRIRAAQRMLWRALGSMSENALNGTYGSGTTRDLQRFFNRANYPDRNPAVITQDTWNRLWPFGDDRAKDLARSAKPPTDPADVVRQHIRSWGEWYVQNRNHISYAQTRPYPKTPHLPIRTDCSGSATHILYMSDCPHDPHERGWDGQGFTGTMYQNGHRISLSSKLLPGDCVFYGNQGGGVPSHVVIVIGPGDRAMTFGHWPPMFVNISSYWRSNVRSDVGARRYF